MTLSNDDALVMLQNIQNELEGLLETEPVEGYAAQDEIEEALNHLSAAEIDLEAAEKYK